MTSGVHSDGPRFPGSSKRNALLLCLFVLISILSLFCFTCILQGHIGYGKHVRDNTYDALLFVMKFGVCAPTHMGIKINGKYPPIKCTIFDFRHYSLMRHYRPFFGTEVTECTWAIYSILVLYWPNLPVNHTLCAILRNHDKDIIVRHGCVLLYGTYVMYTHFVTPYAMYIHYKLWIDIYIFISFQAAPHSMGLGRGPYSPVDRFARGWERPWVPRGGIPCWMYTETRFSVDLVLAIHSPVGGVRGWLCAVSLDSCLVRRGAWLKADSMLRSSVKVDPQSTGSRNMDECNQVSNFKIVSYIYVRSRYLYRDTPCVNNSCVILRLDYYYDHDYSYSDTYGDPRLLCVLCAPGWEPDRVGLHGANTVSTVYTLVLIMCINMSFQTVTYVELEDTAAAIHTASLRSLWSPALGIDPYVRVSQGYPAVMPIPSTDLSVGYYHTSHLENIKCRVSLAIYMLLAHIDYSHGAGIIESFVSSATSMYHYNDLMCNCVDRCVDTVVSYIARVPFIKQHAKYNCE